MGESVQEESVSDSNVNEEMYEDRDNDISDTLNSNSERHNSSEEALTQTKSGRIRVNENNALDLQISTMIEKSDCLWKCKVCGKPSTYSCQLREHAESHIEGMSHACHICNKSFSTRPSLRHHIKNVHSELSSCDLCGKSGMNKSAYYTHKQTRQHKTLSGALVE